MPRGCGWSIVKSVVFDGRGGPHGFTLFPYTTLFRSAGGEITRVPVLVDPRRRQRRRVDRELVEVTGRGAERQAVGSEGHTAGHQSRADRLCGVVVGCIGAVVADVEQMPGAVDEAARW